MASPETRMHVFVSYSHEDEEYLARLQAHLRPFERNGLIDAWSDTRIKAGQDWQQEIDTALKKATAAILLISADFLASDYIINNELPLLLKAQTEGVKIIPVILKPCILTEYPDLARLQSINDPEESVISLDEFGREKLWSQVANAVQTTLQERGIDITSRLPPSPPEHLEAEQTQNPFTQHVRQEIGILLKRPILSPLRTTLLEGTAQAEQHDSPEAVLIPPVEPYAIETSRDLAPRHRCVPASP